MNARLYETAGALTDEERKRDLGAFFHSLHGTLNHLLLADRIWLGRFLGDAPLKMPLDGELYADFDELRRERVRTDDEIVVWIDAMTDDRLAASFSYSNSRGESFQHPLWYAVLHCFNHQTHHRGQATTLLMQLGKDPGVTDLIGLLRTPDWAST